MKLFIKSVWRYRSTFNIHKQKAGPGKYALLSIPVLTFGLGTWQVQRRIWKLNLIEKLQAKINEQPIDLPEDLNKLSELEYRKVKVKGTFDHRKEIYIGPRSLVTEDGQYAGSKFQTTPETGYFVVTPLHLSDREIAILVNRGWVPKNKTLPETRIQGQVGGEISLVGVVRSSEKKPTFSPKNDPSKNTFYFRDIEEMAKKCKSAPVLIDADIHSSTPGGPVGGQTRTVMRNQHMSYILTWYALSAITALMWYQKYGRGKVVI